MRCYVRSEGRASQREARSCGPEVSLTYCNFPYSALASFRMGCRDRRGEELLVGFAGFHVKKHEMVDISKSSDVVVIRRKSWKPHAFRTAHGRELMALEIQMIDGARRNSGVWWHVSEKQRAAIRRPAGEKFVALAV